MKHRTNVCFSPGLVVLARISNTTENRGAMGKLRPVILIEKVEGQWNAMGLTTNPTYRSGAPRLKIPNPHALGLRKDGYLWGDRLAKVSVLDLGDVIGRVDQSLIELLRTVIRLPAGWPIANENQ